MRVLIAEDDPALGPLLTRGFQAEGCTVTCVQDGDAALCAWREAQYALLLLDLNMPRKDGMEVLEVVRRSSAVAILVLTARNTLDERLRCLELGADDFLSKPFSLRELQLRSRRLLQRVSTGAGALLRCGALEMDRVRHTVTHGGRELDLTAKEFSLLVYLLEHRGECISRTRLLEHVWQMHPGVNTNVVDVYINYLRRKLEEAHDEKLIYTVRGNGYVLRGPSERLAPGWEQTDLQFLPG